MPTSYRYLHGHHDSVLRSHRQRTVENSAAYVLARIQPNNQILDVGCGPGTITMGFARRVEDGSAVGVDMEASIIDQARTSADQEGISNLTFEVGDVYSLQFDNGTFDVVHAHQVLQHLGDPVRALQEMRRTCRPEGLVACRDGDYGAMFWYPDSAAMARWKELYREVARSAGGEPDAGRHLAGWARAAGFSHVEVSASIWCFSLPEERHWWGELWAERLTASRFAEQAVEAGLASPADLEALAEGWRTWLHSEDGCFLVPHVEILCIP